MKPGVLFLCRANSCRSQMAEGFARRLLPAGTPVFSAGTAPGGVNPRAIASMAEVGIDIRGQRSKGLEEVPLDEVGLVVTLCDEAGCPAPPPNTRVLHWPMPDPAAAGGSEEEIAEVFRRVRDDIGVRVVGLARRLAVEVTP